MKKQGGWAFFLLFTAYLAMAFALLVAPDRGPFLLLLLSALIVLVGWLMGSGVAGLLALVTCMMCLGLWTQWPRAERWLLAAGLAQIWVLWHLQRLHEQRALTDRFRRRTDRQGWEKQSAELRKDIEFFQRRTEEMRNKSSHRQTLAGCAKDLGALLDTAQIQARLLSWTKKSFPDANGFLAGLHESDPVDAWVIQRRQPLLCEDIAANPAFWKARIEAGTRSLMLAPLWVENKLFGGLRVENGEPKRFTRDDLRVLDALATLGSLALDNAVLYHRTEEAAVRDGLTQLLTHRAFEERLGEELLRAGRYRYPVSLLMLDVDHFKRVNDTYGHPVGDEVLRRLSRRLGEAARPVDVAARYGGEEFTLVLVDMDKDAAAGVAEKFRSTMERETFDAGGRGFSVSVSIGVAVYPREATSPPQLVRAADQRLYRAKSGGRNRVVSEDL